MVFVGNISGAVLSIQAESRGKTNKPRRELCRGDGPGTHLSRGEKDAPGLSFGRPEDKMGLTSTSSRELHFDDCRVPVGNLLGKEGEGMQVIGGHGYCRDYIVERLFRDARGLTLHFKTSEWLRQDIAKAALTL